MKRAIITGATGSIGTALIDVLIKNGVEILVFSRKNSKRLNNIPKHPLVSIFDCDLAGLKDVVNNTGKKYDAFFHFAWDGTYGDSRNDLMRQIKNVEYEIDAIHAAVKFGCHTFVGAGSQAEYGRTSEIITEKLPCFPENGYGICKLAAGQLGALECDKLGIKHCWVRIVSAFGKNDYPESLVISAINCFKNNDGGAFTEGNQLWDYVSANDAAEAFYAVAEKGINGKTYVLCSGKARRLKEYIIDIADVMSFNGSINFGKVAYSNKQVMNLLGDNSLLKKDTGWCPKHSFKEEIKIIADYLNDRCN